MVIFRRKSTAGFTLIELLIVVAVIGLIAAIAIPNLLNAIHKARQKRSMGDIRTVGSALSMYQRDDAFYPVVSNGDASAIRAFPHVTIARPVRDRVEALLLCAFNQASGHEDRRHESAGVCPIQGFI